MKMPDGGERQVDPLYSPVNNGRQIRYGIVTEPLDRQVQGYFSVMTVRSIRRLRADDSTLRHGVGGVWLSVWDSGVSYSVFQELVSRPSVQGVAERTGLWCLIFQELYLLYLDIGGVVA